MSGIGSESPTGLTNDFSSIPNTSIESMAEDQRVQPRQIATGVTRGTLRINNLNGSYVSVGVLSVDGDEYGMSISDGTTTFLKITKDGMILNDGTNNRLLIGKSTSGF